MTMYIKKKDNRTVEPKTCFRCQSRLGEVQLVAVEAAGDPETPRDDELWLCSTCIAEVQRLRDSDS